VAQEEILIKNTHFIYFYIRVKYATYRLYATVHIILLSNPVSNKKSCDKYLKDTKTIVMFTVRQITNNFTDAFLNIVQHSTPLQTLSPSYSDIILSTSIDHAPTKC